MKHANSAVIWFVAATGSMMTAGPVAGQGSIFLTGHDPDYHANYGDNPLGAQNFNHLAIGYVNDPSFNPYVAPTGGRFLFVESSTPDPGHGIGKNGILASGYIEGVDFDQHDASTLNAALDGLGTTYSAIVVASDFGGIFRQAELNILNARAGDIASFINSGGGIYACAESGLGSELTTHDRFGFIPGVIAGATDNQSENGFTLSPFGESLGFTLNEVNGNFSHNIFTAYAGLNPVDFDPDGDVVSVAGRVSIPSPGMLGLLGMTVGLVARRRR